MTTRLQPRLPINLLLQLIEPRRVFFLPLVIARHRFDALVILIERRFVCGDSLLHPDDAVAVLTAEREFGWLADNRRTSSVRRRLANLSAVVPTQARGEKCNGK